MTEKVFTIEKVVFGGKGISRDLQKVTFVPYTLAGEKVRARIKKDRRDYIEAEATEILEPSPDRVPPDCRYFGTCGGCQISHASYRKQLAMKEETLRETLRRNHLEIPEVQIIPGKPFGYRHRARLKFDAKHRRLGFFQAESNQVTDIHECLCLTPGLNRLLHLLRNRLLTAHIPGLTEIDCYENHRGETAAFFNASLPTESRAPLKKETRVHVLRESDAVGIRMRFRNYELPMHPDIFLQANPDLWNVLVQEVESHQDNSKNRVAVELYSGAGFFTVPLSKKFQKIIAVEENEAAVRFAKENHSSPTIEWVCDKAETFDIPEGTTAVIVDPPRAGLHRNVVRGLLTKSVERITYVSCDCASFARDVKNLRERYRLSKLTLIDLFPQTYHFETVALLAKI